ncbi:MAG: PBSX family phage terminase large subunit [Bacteroidaceae bacterium]|nr:PBSX family phage terminase large subunit [Bacteroidaceae bacterium]
MISPKQKKILAFPYSGYDALICDGAVRSGKTSIMIVAFIDWAMREFSNQRFGICGKTVDSATKNIITPYISMAYAKDRYTMRWRRSDKILEVSRGTVRNYFEVFGGKDESSFMLIQGRTFAGVLMDEVALMPQSFVQQAMARCSVDGSRLWFSCNPDNPNHWFYLDWIQRSKERNALYLRFSMEDNPSLSEKVLNQYKSRYSGVFYDRYIRGLWVAAEGLVYPMYDNTVPTEQRPYEKYVISMDYGIQNPTAMGLWGLCDGVWYQVKEFYHSGRETNSQKTDQQYYDELEKLAGDLPVWRLIVDPSASSFIALVNQKKRFTILKANNDVLEGIQHTAQCLTEGKIKVNDCCKRTIQEYGLYRWDEKSTDDRPIKENDHAMDMTRYFVNTMAIWRNKAKYTPMMYR